MRVRILGTAAGGGLPQWNCGCPVCQQSRRSGVGRTQDGLAITGDGVSWYLVNASPDLRAQLMAYPEFAPPPGTRNSPICGALLTSAELDHTLGLLTLREADRLTIWATATVRTALPLRPALESYVRVDWCDVVPGRSVELVGGLVVTAFAPDGKRPRYASGPDSPDWTVAYRLMDRRTGGVLIYAPGLARWSSAFASGIDGADVVILDGTFASDREFDAGRPMGHMSIEDSLPRLTTHPGPRYLYTHLNNTNPYAHRREITDVVRVAQDGELLVL